MRKISKILGVVLSVIICGSSLALFGCTSSTAEGATVMNLSVNPEIEFVLDADDKIVSVNAVNEEGNLIISADAFKNVVGKTAEEGTEIFLSVAVDTGFIVKGRVSDGENEIEISVSGQDAQSIYDKVKAHAQDFFTSQNITAQIENFEALTKEDLEELLQEAKPYLTEAELKAKQYADIVKELAEERKATAGMYSQEIKKAYYEAKAIALEQAEIETLKSKLSDLGKQAIGLVSQTYNSAVEQLEQTRYDLLVKADSVYQKALDAFYVAKAEFLNYRNYVAGLAETEVTTAILEQLDSLKVLVDKAEEDLISAKESANEIIDGIEDTLNSAYNTIINTIESFLLNSQDFVNDVAKAQKQAINDFTTEFENKHKEVKEKAKQRHDEIRKAFIGENN